MQQETGGISLSLYEYSSPPMILGEKYEVLHETRHEDLMNQSIDLWLAVTPRLQHEQTSRVASFDTIQRSNWSISILAPIDRPYTCT